MLMIRSCVVSLISLSSPVCQLSDTDRPADEAPPDVPTPATLSDADINNLVEQTDRFVATHIAADKPDGVPEEDWLPIEREHLDLNPMFRLYAPDVEAYEAWGPPKAEQLDQA